MKYLSQTEQQVYDKVQRYTSCFTATELESFENEIFGKLTKNQRTRKEYHRLKVMMKNNSHLYASHISSMCELDDLVEMMEFDSSITDDAMSKIVRLQLESNMEIRLYSALPRLEREYNYLTFKRCRFNFEERPFLKK